jgi:hypothetical protein
MRVAYFVHDLNDPAVARRVRMLRAGGLDVVAAGFWRGEAPPHEIDDAPALPLARTFDARLAGRALATVQQTLHRKSLRDRLGAADLFVARNLEMLAIAARQARGATPVVYESLDLHRLLLGHSVASSALRRIEAALMRRASLLITSSPGFLRAYFHNPAFARPHLPTLVVENRPLQLDDGGPPPVHSPLPPGPPWTVGWFGMLRCRRSLEMLARLARTRPDLVRVRIFGRAADPVRNRLAELARTIPALEFGGAYDARDLGRLYAGVHFNWTIDYFEENANSEWLLPNRIYEGGSADVIPLALSRTETGRWLKAHGLGVQFDEPQTELEDFLEGGAPARYERLKRAAVAAPRSHFVAARADCVALAESLAGLVCQPNKLEAPAIVSGVAA